MYVWGFIIIDELYDAQQITNHIADMSPHQRKIHLVMTATLDVIYPFTYASFFVGVTLKAFPGLWLLAAPSLLCVLFDLVEGYSQVMLLSGHDEYMATKTMTTPVKLFLFATSTMIAIGSVVRLKFGDKRKARQD